MLRVQGIRLDQHTLQLQLPKQLPQHCLLIVLAGGMVKLTDRHAQGCGVRLYLSHQRRATTAVGLIEPRRVLASHTSWSRTAAPFGI